MMEWVVGFIPLKFLCLKPNDAWWIIDFYSILSWHSHGCLWLSLVRSNHVEVVWMVFAKQKFFQFECDNTRSNCLRFVHLNGFKAVRISKWQFFQFESVSTLLNCLWFCLFKWISICSNDFSKQQFFQFKCDTTRSNYLRVVYSNSFKSIWIAKNSSFNLNVWPPVWIIWGLSVRIDFNMFEWFLPNSNSFHSNVKTPIQTKRINLRLDICLNINLTHSNAKW